MSNVVLSGQSFFNKVVQATGDIDNAFEMMLQNNMQEVTNRLSTGQSLKSSAVTNWDVVVFFEDLEPATFRDGIKEEINYLDYLFPGEFPYSF